MERHQTISKRTDTRFPYTMLFRSQILGGRVGEQGVDFGSELAKLLGADAGAAHQAQLVLDQRVADFDDLHRWTVWWRRRARQSEELSEATPPTHAGVGSMPARAQCAVAPPFRQELMNALRSAPLRDRKSTRLNSSH